VIKRIFTYWETEKVNPNKLEGHVVLTGGYHSMGLPGSITNLTTGDTFLANYKIAGKKHCVYFDRGFPIKIALH